jgi:hypothetical protein
MASFRTLPTTSRLQTSHGNYRNFSWGSETEKRLVKEYVSTTTVETLYYSRVYSGVLSRDCLSDSTSYSRGRYESISAIWSDTTTARHIYINNFQMMYLNILRIPFCVYNRKQVLILSYFDIKCIWGVHLLRARGKQRGRC